MKRASEGLIHVMIAPSSRRVQDGLDVADLARSRRDFDAAPVVVVDG
jgi:hypothetical protein